ncbi:DNA primase [Helicobacter mustelae]|uniref:DNA primase n=1 Tax=Helicobacter mustelae (strain ATCC 43772 / CCUG 25715 / CIP 103759 / LMG 18044 / NCTC 12198 / R85-136P) TaxID=679897 RepID=D3UI23_HELM1|nr:DNA primase [Helicobacter mustelae]CBG40146.1 DNA primase [Helicobacter mustelae 12198]SQH71649.1 DNA primase [Helicobacter mustelae]
MIKASSIEALKQQADIIDILGNYIELKRAGSNFSACCPFHQEKTPSFIISPSKNLYHCYGCGVGGDVIKFVMEYEKIPFIEAVEKIAELSHFTLEYETSHQKPKQHTEEYEIFERFIHFFGDTLAKEPGILAYLQRRGISAQSMRDFSLGYCGNSFEVVKFCDQLRLEKKNLVGLGILGQSDGRYYARFAERIIFPIHSPAGNPVGFGGRTLRDHAAKYINSPQSQLFNKSKLLYGYHIAKEFIYRERTIIITEGYLDVIMLHQAGFRTAVATLGTALTQEHLPLLNKGEPKILLGYDGDSAGIRAAYRASFMLANLKKEGGVVIFQNGMDPADMVQKNQISDLKELFSHPMPFIEFVLRQIPLQFDLTNPLQKEQALKQQLDFLHTLSPLLQEEYKALISNLLQISPSLIPTKPTKHQENFPSSRSSKPGYSPTLYGNGGLGFLHQESQLEELIIRYILETPSLLDLALQYIDAEIFQHQKQAFCALLAKNLDHPSLIGIRINPKLITTPHGFRNELRLLILRYNTSLLNSIQKERALSFEQKSFRIRKIKNHILKLKQGELIAYESFGTF